MLPVLLSLALQAHAADDVGGNELTYEGGYSQTASGYVKGGPVTISHTGGNLAVRCIDTPTLNARLQYVVYGSQEAPMESMGKGIGLSVSGGSVKSRMPAKPSGVSKADSTLTVNIPAPTTSVTITQTGEGWVQVIGCDGNVKVSAGLGGAYVSGHITGITLTAQGGDVKFVESDDAVLKSTSTITSPKGNATVQLATGQGGKLNATGQEVASTMTVVGTNSSTIVQGDLGLAGPSITVSAPNGKVDIGPNN